MRFQLAAKTANIKISVKVLTQYPLRKAGAAIKKINIRTDRERALFLFIATKSGIISFLSMLHFGKKLLSQDPFRTNGQDNDQEDEGDSIRIARTQGDGA